MDKRVINGHKFGWASVTLNVDDFEEDDVVEINHKWMTERGKVRGKGTRVKGYTRGEDDVEGDITVNKAAYHKLLTRLKEKYGKIADASFTITISSSETGEDEIITEELIGCRLAGGEAAVKQGTDGLTVKIPLHIMSYTSNGVDPHE